MEIAASKRQLLDIVDQVSARDYVKSRPQFLHELNSLMSDIHRDFYTVVVLGEFKRGKSTFINAILGEPLLPMDVLPETAVISAIMYDDEPCIGVVHSDGTATEGEVSREYLQRFSAQSAEFTTQEDREGFYREAACALGHNRYHVPCKQI